jgi:hypothetical protein
VLVGSVVASCVVGAQFRLTLPPGVTGIAFGKAQKYKDASGKEVCAIVDPLPDPPVFERGVTEISYGVQLQPRAVKSAASQVVAPAGQGELHRAPCHVFTLIKGGFSQTQLGSTISRLDKAPLKPGGYSLRVTIDGQTVDVPFAIK